MRLQQIRWT